MPDGCHALGRKSKSKSKSKFESMNQEGFPMLTAEVLRLMESSVLCWLATVDADGAPHVSPKEIFVPFGSDTVLVAHIASPNTVRNIRTCPKVCLSFVEVFIQKGFKLQGHASIVTPQDAAFAEVAEPLIAKAGAKFPVHSVICIKVERVEPILAPSYRLFPGTTEETRVASALKTYGVSRGVKS
jgi:uncharacterized protein